jgi:hypothetical protein
MTRTLANNSLHRTQCLVRQANRPDPLKEATGRRLGSEVRFDDLRERLARPFVAREYTVGFHVDCDRLDGHALIVHLDLWPVNTKYWCIYYYLTTMYT